MDDSDIPGLRDVSTKPEPTPPPEDMRYRRRLRCLPAGASDRAPSLRPRPRVSDRDGLGGRKP
jgi:hypothetical protein